MSIQNNSNLRKGKCQEKKISQASLGDLQAGILPYIEVPKMRKKSGNRVALLPLRPLRTVRDSFPSHGSSTSQAYLCIEKTQ
jgi:hypothetical protein